MYFYISEGADHGRLPVTTPAEYREIAEECLEAMRATISPEVRAELLRLALRWEEIAEEIERRQHLQAADFGAHRPPAHYASAFR
jgi:hypothetical protein